MKKYGNEINILYMGMKYTLKSVTMQIQKLNAMSS